MQLLADENVPLAAIESLAQRWHKLTELWNEGPKDTIHFM
jgi:hypothetical protein